MGGIYNSETDQTEWTTHVPLDEQLAHYRAHPPSALAGLTAKPVDVNFAFDGHGEPVNAVFELTCPCGSALFIATAYLEDEEWQPPIALECTACEAEHVIYDRSKHGYDAVVGGGGSDEPDDDAVADELTPDDVDVPHQVLIRFEFPSDHLGGDADVKGREHDLFSWITILARDAQTGDLAFLFDDECA
ncbi:MAG TPA: hypothetical protein VM261_18715 [Kofleriaceae bacterium]|nr:hypothetical protein [Kofleriaceae bacterium]